MPSASTHELKGREPRVLELLLQGRSRKAIGQQLGISVGRVGQIIRSERFQEAMGAATREAIALVAARTSHEALGALRRMAERGAGERLYSDETRHAQAADATTLAFFGKLADHALRRELDAARRGATETAAEQAASILGFLAQAQAFVPPAMEPPSLSPSPPASSGSTSETDTTEETSE